MEISVKLLTELFYKKIKLNDKFVPIVHDLIQDKTVFPCITIDNTGGQSFVLRYQETNHYINTDDEIVNEVMDIQRYDASARLHLWVDYTGSESLILMNNFYEQVMNVLSEQVNHNYKHCCNYHDGQCSFLETSCEVHTYPNNRWSKESKCPDTINNHYTNWFEKLHIIPCTFEYDRGYDANNLKSKNPKLHKIIGFDFVYDMWFNLGGSTINDIKFVLKHYE